MTEIKTYSLHFLFSFHGRLWDGEGLAAGLLFCAQNLRDKGTIVRVWLSGEVLRVVFIRSVHIFLRSYKLKPKNVAINNVFISPLFEI